MNRSLQWTIVPNDNRNPYDKFEWRTFHTLQHWKGLKGTIEILPLENKNGIKTPDIKMNGLLWEVKNPHGKGKYVISRNLYTASKQSENIILDLRRMTGSYRRYLPEIEREFQNNHRAKRLLVITKAQTIIEISK